MESLSTSQNKIVSQISLMFERLSVWIDQISSQAANDKAEDSSTPQRDQWGCSTSNGNTHQASSSHCYAPKLVKLDFLGFEGGLNPTSWLYRAKQFFEIHETPTIDRVSLALFHLEGDAQLWYQMLKHESVYISWNEFKEGLYSRYILTNFSISLESKLNCGKLEVQRISK